MSLCGREGCSVFEVPTWTRQTSRSAVASLSVWIQESITNLERYS